MRPFLLSILALTMVLGCKKSSSVNPLLFGDWKLKAYTWGIGQVRFTTPDSVTILSLHSDFHYERRFNDSLYDSGPYTAGNVQAAYNGSNAFGLSFIRPTYSAYYEPGYLITLDKDTLILSANVAVDGGFTEYIRVK